VKVRVEVGLRPGVLDPEAATIERSLHGMGFTDVRGLRQTRVFEFELEAPSAAEAEARAQAMCEKLLANPVTESYRLSVTG